MQNGEVEIKPKLARAIGKKNRDLTAVKFVVMFLLAFWLLASCFVIIGPGQRGVLMRFGRIEDQILGEGIHVIIPLVNTVEKISVRVQNQEISAEASSKDLQEVYTDVALNWHIMPSEVNLIFQRVGAAPAIVQRIINPAVEEVLKAVMAKYTAEEIITKRGEVKAGVDDHLKSRLANYHIALDDISLVHVRFSQRFSDAVEAKQIAEQEAKRAEFIAQKAAKEAEAKVNLAKGEAEAQRLLRDSLTPELLTKQAIEKWNGELPVIVGSDAKQVLNLTDIIKSHQPAPPP
ncbi:MAG TPA: prohibitin family protein [Oscillatoriaceae cyanobacterium M33_DOE_052]|uniref:Prohibitin family protein n=1 Tax=Planktothricoides sp. SpSt-374 TaxID=2282167 RepID=A0A7C3ZTT0_9CYAN|nr:prohibitin family protein [Oscillatoriaceae cyanobacterium M33_DOE_052]